MDKLDEILDLMETAREDLEAVADSARAYIETTSEILDSVEFEGKDEIVTNLALALEKLGEL